MASNRERSYNNLYYFLCVDAKKVAQKAQPLVNAVVGQEKRDGWHAVVLSQLKAMTTGQHVAVTKMFSYNDGQLDKK